MKNNVSPAFKNKETATCLIHCSTIVAFQFNTLTNLLEFGNLASEILFLSSYFIFWNFCLIQTKFIWFEKSERLGNCAVSYTSIKKRTNFNLNFRSNNKQKPPEEIFFQLTLISFVGFFLSIKHLVTFRQC